MEESDAPNSMQAKSNNKLLMQKLSKFEGSGLEMQEIDILLKNLGQSLSKVKNNE